MGLALLAVAVLAAAAYVFWLATDKVVYDGPAFATWNNMKHCSGNSRTVFVTLNQTIGGKPIHVATVSLAAEAKIRQSIVAHPVQVTFKQRLFSEPRIAALAA